MPELPEVETVRRVLLPHLKNREIERVEVCSAGVIACPGAEEFTRSVTGARITDLKRRGKYLRFLLSDGGMMVLQNCDMKMCADSGNFGISVPAWRT